MHHPKILFNAIFFSLLFVLPLAADNIPVRGLVVDEQGESIAGARVRLVPTVGPFVLAERQLDDQEETAPATLEVKSDKNGKFRLEAPEAGIWRLKIDARGHVGTDLLLSPLLEETDLPVAELSADVGLEVVVTASGKPVAGARVHGHRTARMGRGNVSWIRRSQLVWTDDQGRARLQRGKGQRLWVRAFQPGYEEVDHDKVGAQRLAITLQPAAARQVEVRDSRGRPVPGAIVQLGEGRFAVGRTGEDGRLEIEVPKKESMPIHVVAADLRILAENVSLPAAKSQPVKPQILTLPELVTLEGRVVTRDRQPLANALVWGSVRIPVKSAGDGKFRFRESAASGHRVQADSAGYFKRAAKATPGTSVTLMLEPDAALRGRVVDASGRAVADVEVQGTWRFRRGGSPRRAAFQSGGRSLSDRQGRFRLRGLVPNESYELTLKRAGFAPLRRKLVVSEDGGDEEAFVLLAGRRGSGVVVDENDQPVAGAEINLRAESAESDLMVRYRSFNQRSELEYSATSGTDGSFHMDDLSSGRFRLEAQRAGFAPVAVPGLSVPEGAGETDLGTLVLVPGARIEGRVVSAQGEPLAAVEIFATDGDIQRILAAARRNDTPLPDAVTDAGGNFVIPDQRPEERVDLRAVKKGYAENQVPGVPAPTETPVEIVLQLASTVSGRVIDEDGDPIQEANVTVRPAEGNAMARFSRGQRGVTDVDGGFVLTDVPPGAIRVEARAKGFQGGDQTEQVQAGKDLEGVVMTLRQGAVVVGTVSNQAGEPVDAASVTLAIGDSLWRASGRPPAARTDGDGAFRLEGVEPGRRTLQVRHGSYPVTTKVVDLELGETRVEIELGGGQTVSGQVVDPEGTPVAGALVGLGPESQRFSVPGNGESSLADGTFEIKGISDGEYSVMVSHSDFANGRLEGIEVKGSPVRGLVVQLEAGASITGRILGLDFDRLAAAEVMAFSQQGGMKAGQVDYEEQYRIPKVAPGEWQVHVQTTGGRRAGGSITVAPGDTSVQLDIEFAEGVTLEGRVLSGGAGVAGVRLSVSSPQGKSNASGVTDHQGNFELHGLEEGKHQLFAFDMRRGMRHSEEIELPTSGPVEVVLSSARLSGRVVDAIDQRPISGAAVRVVSASGDDDNDFMSSFMGNSSSDDRGSFTIASVSAGDWKLIAEREGYSPSTQTLSVAGDEEINGLELRMSPTDGLWVAVSHSGGARPSQVLVAMLDESATPLSVSLFNVDAESRIFLPSVPPGPVRLLVGGSGYATVPLAATAPTDRPSITLVAEAVAEVDVPELRDDTTPAEVQLFASDGQPFISMRHFGGARNSISTVAGRAVVVGLPAGTWRIDITAVDGRKWSGSVTTVPGQRQVVEIN